MKCNEAICTIMIAKSVRGKTNVKKIVNIEMIVNYMY